MAFPRTIDSTYLPHAGSNPPHLANGKVYQIVGLFSGTAVTLHCFAESDPDVTPWTEIDSADRPQINSGAGSVLECISSVLDGDLIHIIWPVTSSTGSGLGQYITFNTLTDQWGTNANAFSVSSSDPAFLLWASIAVRSDGTVVAAFSGANDAVMGGDKERVDYAIRSTGGTWGGAQALDAAGDVHYGNPSCALGSSDGVHILWQVATNTTDPPTRWEGPNSNNDDMIEGRTLDSVDALSTVTARTSTISTEYALLGNALLISYDDAGTQRIFVPGITDTSPGFNNRHVYQRSTEDGSGNIQTPTSTVVDVTADPYVNGEVGVVSAAVDTNGDLHVLYSGGGTKGVDQDIYYTTSDDDGATWSTPTEELNTVTCNFISSNIYVRGSDTVLAYVYDDAGTTKYNEKILIAGGNAASGSPSVTKYTASGSAIRELPSDGSPSITKPTADGSATRELPADGSPSITKPTADGSASIVDGVTADGSPSITPIEAAGASEVIKSSDGSPSIAPIEAAGVSEIVKTASGSPSISPITAAGVSEILREATGSPSISPITAAGVSEIIRDATGSPSISPITAAGNSFIWPKVYLNTSETLIGATEMTISSVDIDGTSITFDDSVGAPVGALFLGVENRVNGDVGWIAVTVTESTGPTVIFGGLGA